MQYARRTSLDPPPAECPGDALNHVSLFSGYEGFGLGLRLAGIPIRTVLYCEYDEYCQSIIRARIRDRFLDDAPIWPDVRTLDGCPFAGRVGILTAGFPCQPHSFAGKRKGEADERNLWPDTLRLISEMGPSWVLLENVPGILANGYAGVVIGQLSEIGYDCEWGVVSAAQVGAPHLRKRWWVLASHSPSVGRLQGCIQESLYPSKSAKWWGDASNLPFATDGVSRLPDSPNIRVCNGDSNWMDRVKTLGNGIVPAVVREFLTTIVTRVV